MIVCIIAVILGFVAGFCTAKYFTRKPEKKLIDSYWNDVQLFFPPAKKSERRSASSDPVNVDEMYKKIFAPPTA